uniref:Envelope glycoprotein n=1 Tax=Strix occidentalis caurina TaxID=311401 RepID=A0A8D0F5H6_STROC
MGKSNGNKSTTTWAEDGSWGYRTPIYMLNRIIQLQAVVETVVNKTGDALSLLAKQNTRMRTAIYQNRLALDYLLAQEGGVCGKFNLTNCCIQIDDEGKAIDELVREMKKVAHVPVQTWNGLDIGNWGSWTSFFNGDWLTKVAIVLLGIFGGLLIIPCILPCFIRLIRSVVQSMQLEMKSDKTPLMILETKTTPNLTAARKAVIELETRTRINKMDKIRGGNCEKHSHDSCQNRIWCDKCNRCTLCGSEASCDHYDMYSNCSECWNQIENV